MIFFVWCVTKKFAPVHKKCPFKVCSKMARDFEHFMPMYESNFPETQLAPALAPFGGLGGCVGTIFFFCL